MASVLRSIQGPGVRPITGPHTGSTFLAETKAFRDRVQSKTNGEVEEGSLEGLYDPVLREAKSAGWDSDLVFFGAGSAVENASGSIATMFDASGGQNDVTQGTSSKRPTLDKSGVGSKWSANGDGSDDSLTGTLPSFTDQGTQILVLKGQNYNLTQIYARENIGSGNHTNFEYNDSNANGVVGLKHKGNGVGNKVAVGDSTDDSVFTLAYDESADTLEAFERKTLLASASGLGTIDTTSTVNLSLLNLNGNFGADAQIGVYISVRTLLSSAERESLLDLLLDFYSL